MASGATIVSPIVLPNGPEMAAAFIAIGSGATTAPLNPAYRQEEFEFYMEDLNARALVVEKGSASPAVAAAKAKGVRILELGWEESDPSGSFSILGETGGAAANGGLGRAGRHRADPAYLGHHVAAEDRAAGSGQYRRLGAPYRRDEAVDARRPLPEHHCRSSTFTA